MRRVSVLVAVMGLGVVVPAWADPGATLPANAEASVDGKGTTGTETDGNGADNNAGAEKALEDHDTTGDAPVVPFSNPSFGPLYTIEHIVVRGNRKTESSLILGEIGLRAGDQVSASDGRVEAARIRLLSLGYFLDAHLALERGTGRGGAILIIDVEERGTIILNALYLGSSAATAFWGGLDVAENNLFGRGISLGAGLVASTRPSVMGATRNFGGRIRTLVPPLGNTGLMLSGTGIFAQGSDFFRVTGSDRSADPANFVALRTKRVGGVVGIGRALNRATRFFLDFREEGVTAELPALQARTLGPGVMDTINFGIEHGFSRVGSLTATVDFDTRSDPLVPRAGTHVALSIEGASSDLGSTYDFMKMVLQGSFYQPAWHGHIVGLHLFGGALFGSAPIFDRFFIGDMNLFLPPRALGLNFSTQPSRDLLGTAIAGHRYDNFAARVLVEYAVPLWRRHRLVYSGDVFIAVGAFGMGSENAFRDPTRSGFGSWPIDLTGDLGVRLDTTIGVFTLSIANALGRVPF